jgi:hypothetical protein
MAKEIPQGPAQSSDTQFRRGAKDEFVSTAQPSRSTTSARLLLSAYKQMLVALFVATLIVGLILIGLLLPFSFLFNTSNKSPPLIFVVILAGALGAFFSALIRLYNFDELPKALIMRELQGLPRGHLIIYSLVPAVVGAISATVLYLIFAGGLLQGGLFPKFGCEEVGMCDRFWTLFDIWHPEQAPDYAKLLVWAFVAGFAERLVPDTLQSFSRAAQSTDKHHDAQTDD